MSRERIFYLDFIRALATIVIVLTHYNAIFLYNVYRPEIAVITLYVGNIYIGAFGVSLFLIISGAALMFTYGNREKLNLKQYYFKRAKTLYPVFWVAYTLCFLYHFYSNFCIPQYAPRRNIIFSILGMDGYLSNFGVKTFYFVGEWYLGFIIIFYIISPAIIWLIRKKPTLLVIITMALYGITLLFESKIPSTGVLLTTRLPELVFGMYFIKYIKKVNWYTALIALCIIVLNTIIAPDFISENIQVTYIGISSFLVLVYVAGIVERFDIIQRVCKVICKYSYACFIIHHWIIYQLVLKFDIASISRFNSYLLCLLCFVLVAFATYLLHNITEKITNLIMPKNKIADTKS